MRMYYSILKIRFINRLQYRAAVIGLILKNFLFALTEILMYMALYRTNPNAFPLGLSQMVSYVWMQQILIVLFSVVIEDWEIYSAISSGSICYDLVRPVDLYGRWFCQSAGNRLAITLVGNFPVLLLALIVPKPYRMSMPVSLGQLLLFIVSTVLAFAVVMAFAMLMYVSLFYIVSQRGIRIIVTAVTTFLSGRVIPLPFFPEKVLTVVRILPFAAMQNMPLQIFCGNISGRAALEGVCFQLFWFVVLLAAGKLFMRQALTRVVVQGG